MTKGEDNLVTESDNLVPESDNLVSELDNLVVFGEGFSNGRFMKGKGFFSSFSFFTSAGSA